MNHRLRGHQHRSPRVGLHILLAMTVVRSLAGSLVPGSPPWTAPAGASASQVELKGLDTQPGDEFAYFTAISGGTILIGAPYHPNGGRAYVFTRSEHGWRQVAMLKGKDTANGDVFGVDGKIDGNEMIVGADQAHQTGAAYIFVKTSNGWQQTAELRAPDATAGNHYALSVAISGSNAIVSTENDDHAYIYHHTGSRWIQTAELTGSDTQPGDEFGFWVDIDGTTAVVGADQHGGGAIYIFNLTESRWTQTAELVGSDVVAGAHFGQNLAISGHAIVVNAPYMYSSAGRVYVFSRVSGGWRQTAELKAADGQPGNWFGWYVSISGAQLVAGGIKTPGGGAAYVFTQAGGRWTQTTELKGQDRVSGDWLGAATGVSGSTVVAGAYGHQGGRAYVFSL
ncbi:MAG TPA: hypothetical protein VNL71_25085 [Chloroflexota bacterium]|nr:hypothetical protein [Chloroflexota bacterium]